MASHTVDISTYLGGDGIEVGWSCDLCNWVGRELLTEAAALSEHASVARQIVQGRLPAA